MNESYARRGYAERGYTERGYTERGYTDRGYADRGRARGGQRSTTAGGVILAVAACLSAFLVIMGLYYAAGDRARYKAALAAAGCEPNLLSINVGCTTVQMLDSRYKSIANPVAQQVNAEVADYTASESHSLTTAEAALRAEVTSENGFAASLARFPFPPSVAPTAKTLIRDMQAQAKLTAQQARSSSLSQMQSFNSRVGAAGAAVETQLRLVSTALAAPVTPNEEP
jgi:hypothetical protein